MTLPALTPESEKKIGYLIDNYKRLGIYIRSLKTEGRVLYIQVEQKKFINDKILSAEELVDRAKDVFKNKLIAGTKLDISPIFSNAEELRSINADYVNKKLEQYHLKPSHLVKYLDLDKSTVSQLVNGEKDFTKPLRAAFYYFFKNYDLKKTAH